MKITLINYTENLPDILHATFLDMLRRNASRIILYENNTLFYEPFAWRSITW